MADEVDPLDRKLGVELSKTDNSISLNANLRSVTAFDRLIGNILDKGNLYLETRNRRKRSIMDAEEKIIEATAEAYIKRIGSDPALADIAIEQHLTGLVRKQKNKEAIVDIAKAELQRLPTSQSEQETEVELDISEDWMNDFESFAEKASSDDMRLLFGKILSGEIRKPGSFSKKSMRTLWELDEESAAMFKGVSNNRFQHYLPIDRQIDLTAYMKLEAEGLLTTGNGVLAARFPKQVNEDKVILAGDEWLIVAEIPSNLMYLSFGAMSLTPAGFQIASLIENDELGAFRKIGEIANGSYIKIDIFKIISKSGAIANIDPSSPVETILGTAKI